MTGSKDFGDIYTHFANAPTRKTFCLMVITGTIQALLLLCVAVDYRSKWSSRWLALNASHGSAGSMASDNPQLLFAMALCKVASLAALVYYVHNEALAAVALMQLLAQRRAGRTLPNERRDPRHNPLLVLVPLWQLLLAVGTLFLQSFIFIGYYLPAGYGSLTINQDSALISDVVFTAVALSFVLELDNKALEMLRRISITFTMESMYSVVFAGATSDAQKGLPTDRLVNLFSVLLNRLIKQLDRSGTADAFYAFVVFIFHVAVMMYTSYTLTFLTVYSFDVFPTFIPSTSQAVLVFALVMVATPLFLGFQLVLGIQLPPPRASTAACESACSQSGRPHVPSRCRIYRWYTLATHIIVPVISAVVNMVVHNVANINGYEILQAAGVDCNLIVTEQLKRTGGSNMSCGNTEVDMISYVSDFVTDSIQGTTIPSFRLCSAFGIRNIFVCSSVWYIGLPFCAWFSACTLVVLVPLLVIMKRWRPCKGCADGPRDLLPTVGGGTAACAGCSTSLSGSFTSAVSDALAGSPFAAKSLEIMGESRSM